VENDLEKQFALIYSYGRVHWYMPIGQSASHCLMDITWFPLDTQHCPLIYESWAFPSNRLNITRHDPAVDLSYYQTSGEWQLVGTSHLLRPITYMSAVVVVALVVVVVVVVVVFFYSSSFSSTTSSTF